MNRDRQKNCKWSVLFIFFLFIRKREESKEETETESQPIKGTFEGLLGPCCKLLLLSVCPICLCELPCRKQAPTHWMAEPLLGGPPSSISSYPSILVEGPSSAPSSCWCPPSFYPRVFSSAFLKAFSKMTSFRSPAAVPNLFDTRASFVGDSFSMTQRGGDGFGMIQMHYIYCALHFCSYHISSTSDHQTLDPRGWGPLLSWLKLPLLCCVPSSSPTPAQISLPNARWTFLLISHRHLQHFQNWNSKLPPPSVLFYLDSSPGSGHCLSPTFCLKTWVLSLLQAPCLISSNGGDWWFSCWVVVDSCNPMNQVAHHTSLSMRFHRQENWSG